MSLAHKLTIEKVSLYFDTEDSRYLTNRFFKKKIEKDFILEFNQMFGGKLNLSEEAFKLIVTNRAYTMLPALHEALRLSIQSGDTKLMKRNVEAYENYFGRPFLKMEQLKDIRKEIDRLKTKADSYKKTTKEKFDFEKLVVGVEQILGITVNRRLKLFQFKAYYDKALKHGRDSRVSK